MVALQRDCGIILWPPDLDDSSFSNLAGAFITRHPNVVVGHESHVSIWSDPCFTACSVEKGPSGRASRDEHGPHKAKVLLISNV